MPTYTKGRKAVGVGGKTGPRTRKKVSYTKGARSSGPKMKTGSPHRKKVRGGSTTKRGAWRFK